MQTQSSSFDWEEYIELAKQLQQNPIPNALYHTALYRAIVSRAYYGAFMYSRRRAERIMGAFSGVNIHEQVIDYYSNSESKNHRKAGTFLKVLKDKRVECDYFDHLTEDPKRMADISIKLADTIINLIL
ncbi:MAG TPA: hypothetical protein PLG55_11530 [Methanospirillum sp.]|jgi:hypothetical protein|uniref:hypothetical protein n=1 Tax=Methanospirillum sp. TaxID=45200 RepID=UPI001B57F214|nr:hypothetical protein [Methanospirillum sp.]MBP9007159.1 hypothetical protein [Methanospirillum sp.]HPY61342.1 hypothetical protein [Methanospirillum sp.]